MIQKTVKEVVSENNRLTEEAIRNSVVCPFCGMPPDVSVSYTMGNWATCSNKLCFVSKQVKIELETWNKRS